MNSFGPAIESIAFKDPEKLRKTVDEVITWDEKTPYNYDHRWINLHGMGSFSGGSSSRSVPTEKWQDLAAQARKDFRAGLEAGLKVAKLQSAPPVTADKELGFKLTNGKMIQDTESCVKDVSTVSECKTCCGAVEPHLTVSQTEQVVRELKSPSDLSKFDFAVPQDYLHCLSQCQFAEISRTIAAK